MEPNFLFIGPDKAGSSWIFRVLSAHPQVFLSPAKDLYFFDRFFYRGKEWYVSRFEGARPEHRIVGEICHDYLYSVEAPQRILETLGPDTFILTCLREPADRAHSDYLNRVRSGSGAGASFRETLVEHPQIVKAGQYHDPLERYISAFPADRVKVVLFDDLQSDPQAFLDAITSWLGISRLVLSAEQAAPARAAAESRSPSLTRWLRRAGRVARAIGLEGLVGRAKSSRRLEGALYREYDERPLPEAEVMNDIRLEVADDVERVEQLTGLPLRDTWGYRT